MELFTLINETFRKILFTYMDNSNSESETEEIYMLTERCHIRKKRNKSVRVENYVENVVPRFSAGQFKQHFRMTPDTFYVLENILSLRLFKENVIGRSCIKPRVQLLATLWLLATPDSYR